MQNGLTVVEHVSLVTGAPDHCTYHIYVDRVGRVAIDSVAAVGAFEQKVGDWWVVGRLLHVDFSTVASYGLVSLAEDWVQGFLEEVGRVDLGD